MKNRGFTLAELLGVIVIISILTLIAFPPIINQIKKNKDKVSGVTLELIYSAADAYMDENPNLFPMNKDDKYCITLEQIINAGLMQAPIKDASGKPIDITKTVSISILDYNGNNEKKFVNESECETQKEIRPTLEIENPNVIIRKGTTYDLKTGVTYSDESGSVELTYTSEPEFDSNKVGTYSITYTATNLSGNKTVKTRTITVIETVYDFVYKGTYEEYIVAQTGYYQLEAWGAGSSGGGAYVFGKIKLNKDDKLYIYVGQEGVGCNPYSKCGASFNGGGAGGFFTSSSYPGRTLTGGGATDFRLVSGNWNDFSSLKSRIMVAAGSGGNNRTVSTSSGGSLTGLNGASGGRNGAYAGTGASQTSGGNGREKGSFGYGGTGYIGDPGTPNCNDGGGGGGGYYGGGSGYGAAAGCNPNADGTGGGGSSFVSGHTGCNAINKSSTNAAITHTNQSNHYSGKIFTDTIMKAGNEVMPNYTSGTMTGNTGNGYARITFISS